MKPLSIVIYPAEAGFQVRVMYGSKIIKESPQFPCLDVAILETALMLLVTQFVEAQPQDTQKVVSDIIKRLTDGTKQGNTPPSKED